jgi:hypothetical protein
MALDLYDQIYAFINGDLLVEATQVQTGLESDDQKIMTLIKGFAGIAPSPDVRVVKVENVVPSTGFEFDFERAKLDRTLIEIKLQSGATGKSMISKGFIMAVNIDAGVGKALTVSFDFVGEPALFE